VFGGGFLPWQRDHKSEVCEHERKRGMKTSRARVKIKIEGTFATGPVKNEMLSIPF